jgi:ribosomal protein S18 acetylase RimI-like enzyme
MEVTFESLLQYSLAEIADLLTRAFEGYIVPIRFEPSMLDGMIRAEAVDINASRVAIINGDPAGIGLIARRGFDCRLAAMAIAPDYRSKGVGRKLVHHVVHEAAERGEQRMLLEVIEQNDPAVRLYESAGFHRMRRLVGFNGEGLAGKSDPSLAECDIRDAALAMINYAPDLPWQISGWTVGQMGSPNRAYRLGPALAVISDT